MIEICERNRFSNFYRKEQAGFPLLGGWVRRLNAAGIQAVMVEDVFGRFAVYREGMEDETSKPLPYGHRVDRRVA